MWFQKKGYAARNNSMSIYYDVKCDFYFNYDPVLFIHLLLLPYGTRHFGHSFKLEKYKKKKKTKPLQIKKIHKVELIDKNWEAAEISHIFQGRNPDT